MLLRLGWRVDVYERAEDDLVNRGAGIATQDLLYDALKTAGVELRDEMGVRTDGRIMFAADGSTVATQDMPQTMTSWGLIYRFLREQVPESTYHRGHVFSNIEQSAGRVRAHFDNGVVAEGDWLIGADGPRSSVRQCVSPETELGYCGYFLWRGLIDETRVPAAVLEQVGPRMMFGMAPGGHWVGYLVAGPDDSLTRGSRWYNWGWYRTGDAAVLRDHLTDIEGTYYVNGIPHDRIRRDLADSMRAEARIHLAPQIQGVVDATVEPFLQGIYDGACDRLVFDRCVLIGDAAFTARPHVGMGVGKAIEDAATLSAALDDTAITAAMKQWENRRLRFGKAVLQWGRDMGSYLGPPQRDADGQAKAAHYEKPEVLLAVHGATRPMQYLTDL